MIMPLTGFFPFVASFPGGSLGFEARCELNRINLHHTDIINKVTVYSRDFRWPEREFLYLWFRTGSLIHAVQRVLRCTARVLDGL